MNAPDELWLPTHVLGYTKHLRSDDVRYVRADIADTLREALEAVVSTSRTGCWCEPSRDIQDFGHAAKCIAVRAALEASKYVETEES